MEWNSKELPNVSVYSDVTVLLRFRTLRGRGAAAEWAPVAENDGINNVCSAPVTAPYRRDAAPRACTLNGMFLVLMSAAPGRFVLYCKVPYCRALAEITARKKRR